MFQKTFSFGVVLLLTGAAVLATPGVSQAQRGGGGHGGGGHGGGGFHGGGGGFHGGGSFHGGGFHGGSFHSGGFHSGYHYGGYPYAHYGYNRYSPYYGGYGYYPYSYGSYAYDPSYYGSYGDDYPSYDTTPYGGSSATYSSLYYSSPGAMTQQSSRDGITYTGPTTSDYQSNYYAPTPSGNAAHVTVNVPADAQVWFDDTATKSTGAVRRYDSPPLTPGNNYHYAVRARWMDNGKEVTQTQQVEVRAGANVRVNFPVAPKAADEPTVPPKP